MINDKLEDILNEARKGRVKVIRQNKVVNVNETTRDGYKIVNVNGSNEEKRMPLSERKARQKAARKTMMKRRSHRHVEDNKRADSIDLHKRMFHEEQTPENDLAINSNSSLATWGEV